MIVYARSFPPVLLCELRYVSSVCNGTIQELGFPFSYKTPMICQSCPSVLIGQVARVKFPYWPRSNTFADLNSKKNGREETRPSAPVPLRPKSAQVQPPKTTNGAGARFYDLDQKNRLATFLLICECSNPKIRSTPK